MIQNLIQNLTSGYSIQFPVRSGGKYIHISISLSLFLAQYYGCTLYRLQSVDQNHRQKYQRNGSPPNLDKTNDYPCHLTFPLLNILTIPVGNNPLSTTANPPNLSLISSP